MVDLEVKENARRTVPCTQCASSRKGTTMLEHEFYRTEEIGHITTSALQQPDYIGDDHQSGEISSQTRIQAGRGVTKEKSGKVAVAVKSRLLPSAHFLPRRVPGKVAATQPVIAGEQSISINRTNDDNTSDQCGNDRASSDAHGSSCIARYFP